MANKKFETLDGINSTGAVVVGNTVTVSGNLAVNTDTLVVNVSQENVGVNTAPSNTYALDVNGNMRATAYYGDGSNLTGVSADDASTLNGISSGSFLRSDVSDSYESGGILSISNSSLLVVSSGGIRLNDNQSFGIGTGADVSFTYNGTQLNVTGSDISFDSDTLFIDVSTDSVGVNTTPAAGYALDVNGNMRATAYYGDGSSLTGIAADTATNANNATYFNTLSSGQFLRSDTTGTHTSGTLIIASSGLRVNDNIPLRFGTGSDVQVKHDGINLNATGTGNVNFSTTGNVNVTNGELAANGVTVTGGGGEGGQVTLKRSNNTTTGGFLEIDSTNQTRLVSTSANIEFRTSTNTLAGRFTGNDLTVPGYVDADDLYLTGATIVNGSLTSVGVFCEGIYEYGAGVRVEGQSNTGTLRVRSGGVVEGNFNVSGFLSKSSGTFKIDHPVKPETHFLYHSFVEGPQADNIYRGKVTLENGEATINLDQHFKMTEGTFAALNRNVDVFTSNEDTWCSVKGKVVGNILTISCESETSNATVSWMVVGERQDKFMLESSMTDEQGKLIIEFAKDEDPSIDRSILEGNG